VWTRGQNWDSFKIIQSENVEKITIWETV